MVGGRYRSKASWYWMREKQNGCWWLGVEWCLCTRDEWEVGSAFSFERQCCGGVLLATTEKENGGWSMQVVALLNEKFGGWTYVISELNLIIHGSIQS